MDLDDVRRNWDDLGKVDPLWAICTQNDLHGNKWDPDKFFATGRVAVADALAELEKLSIDLEPAGRALDFGCGFGRLTLALADHFENVVGVDIAESMLEGAQQYNSTGDRVSYVHNTGSDLSMFETDSFDLVLSIIVLQHIENRYKIAYLKEFLRVLKPGGVLYVTIPSHPNLRTPMGLGFKLLPNRLLNLYRKKRFGYDGLMELHGMRSEEVSSVIEAAGGRLVDQRPDDSVGAAWHALRYVVIADG